MRKVAIYARQSLDKEDNFSIEKQIDDCKKRIGSGVPIEEFVDKGFSGKNMGHLHFPFSLLELTVQYQHLSPEILYRDK
jgi:hypothetical protein